MRRKSACAVALMLMSAAWLGCAKNDTPAETATPPNGSSTADLDVSIPQETDDVRVEMPEASQAAAPAAPPRQPAPAPSAERSASEAPAVDAEPQSWPSMPIFRALSDAVRKGAVDSLTNREEEPAPEAAPAVE